MNRPINSRFRISSIFLSILFLVIATVTSVASPPADDPSGIVQELYRFHISHPNGSDEETIKAHRGDFLPSLYDMLVKEWKKPSKPDEVPDIDWDILLASQEFPTSYKVGKPVIGPDGNAKVDVRLAFSPDKSMVEVRLARTKDGWKISDLYYPSEKQTLSDELRALNGKK